MQVTITDARKNGKPALTLYWDNKLPGSSAPQNAQVGAMWLYHIMPVQVVQLPFAHDGDWQMYTTELDGRAVRVMYTDAHNLETMKTEAFRAAAVAGMMNVFVQPIPESLEEHLWCLDGQYLWGYDGNRKVVGQVSFGVREDDSWGPIWKPCSG